MQLLEGLAKLWFLHKSLFENEIKHFIPIHTMKVKRIYRILPIIFSILNRLILDLNTQKIFVIHHHHTTILDLLTFSIIKTILGVDRKMFYYFSYPKHFQNIKLLGELKNILFQMEFLKDYF